MIEADSARGVEFMGFNYDTAATIFNRYDSRDPNDPFGLIAYVEGHINQLNVEVNYQSMMETLTPAQAMTRLGIRQDVQDAILDPQFDVLFKTESLHYWLMDTLKNNYWTLQQLLENATVDGASTKLNADYYGKTSDARLPDHTVLYRGQSAADLIQRRFVQQDGSFDLDRIWTSSGDFNIRCAATYFTPQHETAELWRAYTARRCKYTETWLIMIQVPNAFLTPLRQMELWYSPKWLEYVWHSRTGARPAQLDKWFGRLGDSVDLVKGHVCSSLERIFSLEKADIPQKIEESDVMRLPSGRWAEQWAFSDDLDLIKRMSDIVRGKVHIRVHGSWQQENKEREEKEAREAEEAAQRAQEAAETGEVERWPSEAAETGKVERWPSFYCP